MTMFICEVLRICLVYEKCYVNKVALPCLMFLTSNANGHQLGLYPTHIFYGSFLLLMLTFACTFLSAILHLSMYSVSVTGVPWAVYIVSIGSAVLCYQCLPFIMQRVLCHALFTYISMLHFDAFIQSNLQ